ncbi:MAG: response regulator [Deltaproteobacteria bacterium]|nr:response regulator [Deltaproteobacteria bacterium]
MGLKQSRILVVDDEESLREICQDTLEEAGYEVDTAPDGETAMRKAVEGGYDLVLSDLRMPGLDGLELLETLQEARIDSAFLIMTGFGTIETAVESMKRGASDYLPKPFNINHLLLKVDKVLRDREQKAKQKKLSNVVRMMNLSNALKSHLGDLRALVHEFLFQVQKNFDPDSLLFFLPEVEMVRKVMIRRALLRKSAELLRWAKEEAEKAYDDGQTRIIEPEAMRTLAIRMDDSMETFEGSAMVVPLLLQKTAIGTILLVRKAEGNSFTKEALQLLTVFATHTGTSIQNAHLYARMKAFNMDVIRSYSRAVEAKDIYTRGHSERVALYARKLAERIGLSAEDMDRLYVAGVLHDIGKIGIPDRILNKPGRLTDAEYDVMKRHPEIGQSILSQVGNLRDVLPVIFHHHERIDGRGYPAGLKGDEIPFLSRLISVVDSYEAMTSDRAYRSAMPLEKVVEILKSGAGVQWDEQLVLKWVEIVLQGEVPELESAKVQDGSLVESIALHGPFSETVASMASGRS